VDRPDDKPCTVTAIQTDGQRVTIELRARSLYSAISNHNYEVVCGSHTNYGYRRATMETIFEVTGPDRVTHTRTQRQYVDWANAEAVRVDKRLQRDREAERLRMRRMRKLAEREAAKYPPLPPWEKMA